MSAILLCLGVANEVQRESRVFWRSAGSVITVPLWAKAAGALWMHDFNNSCRTFKLINMESHTFYPVPNHSIDM